MNMLRLILTMYTLAAPIMVLTDVYFSNAEAYNWPAVLAGLSAWLAVSLWNFASALNNGAK